MVIKHTLIAIGSVAVVLVLFGVNFAIAQEGLIGKWHEIGDKSETVEFFSDGKFSYADSGRHFAGTWRLLDDNRVRLNALVRGRRIIGTGRLESNILAIENTTYVRVNASKPADIGKDSFASQMNMGRGVEQRNKLLAKLLADLSKKVDYYGNSVPKNEGLPLIKKYIRNGGDIDVSLGDNGLTLLQFAVSSEYLDVAKKLVSVGANVNPKNYLWPPLYSASVDKNVEMARLLLENGANPNMDKGDGWAPIHVAVFAEGESSLALVKLLVKHGANVNLPSPNGETPYEEAVNHKLYKIAEFLRAHGAH